MAVGLTEPGFCLDRCEADDYLESSRILGLVGDIEGKDNETGAAFSAMSDIHEEILEECVRGANQTPCSGKVSEGHHVEGWPSGNAIHCPVVVRALGNLNMAHFSD